MSTTRRVGSFLEVTDEEECRYPLRLTTVQLLSDTDMLQIDTLTAAAGRTIPVPGALDQITACWSRSAVEAERRASTILHPAIN